MNTYDRIAGLPPSTYPLAVTDRCAILNTNPLSIREFRQAHDGGRIRELFHLPADATVFLCVCISPAPKISDAFLQAGIRLLSQYASAHILFSCNVQTTDEQKQIDILMNEAWVAGVRQRVHVFCNVSDLYPLFAMADYYVIPIESTDQDDCRAISHEFDLPVILPSSRPLEEKMAEKLHDTQSAEARRIVRSAMPSGQSASEKSDVSIIMRLSRPDTITEAVTSALATFPAYRECIIALSPSLPSSIRSELEGIPRTEVVTGTDNREEAGDLHYRLLDMAQGAWIANVDDDDLWTYTPDLSRIDPDIGLIHGHHLYMNFYHPITHQRYIALEKGRPVHRPADANGVSGSLWIMRRSAWQSISPLMTNRTFNHSDWRMYYALVKNGWKALYMPRSMGIIRRFSYDFHDGRQWINSLEELLTAEGGPSSGPSENR